jgi:hypothetical protein
VQKRRRRLSYFFIVVALSASQQLWAAEGETWGAAPSTELLKLLEEVNQQYGPDAVVLLGSLLHAANHSGSLLTASVRINGTEIRDNSSFLTFQVETGLIFNTTTSDHISRLSTLWRKILAEAFARLRNLQVPTDGILVSLRYYQRPYGDTKDLSELTDAPGTVEEAKFYFGGESLRAFLDNKLAAQELIARTSILLNNTPVAFTLPPHRTEQEEAEGKG